MTISGHQLENSEIFLPVDVRRRIPANVTAAVLSSLKMGTRGSPKPPLSAVAHGALLRKRNSEVNYVGFEVFTAATLKNAAFWDVAPCGVYYKPTSPSSG
jgi:hypothetical protein